MCSADLYCSLVDWIDSNLIALAFVQFNNLLRPLPYLFLFAFLFIFFACAAAIVQERNAKAASSLHPPSLPPPPVPIPAPMAVPISAEEKALQEAEAEYQALQAGMAGNTCLPTRLPALCVCLLCLVFPHLSLVSRGAHQRRCLIL